MRDSGFDCFQEEGFIRIGHGMWNRDMKRKWDPDPVNSVFA